MVRVPESKIGLWLEQQERIKRGEVEDNEEAVNQILESMGYDPSKCTEEGTAAAERWMEEWYRAQEEEFRRSDELYMKHLEERRRKGEK